MEQTQASAHFMGMCEENGIRHAKPTDAASIAEIHVRSWQAAYDGIIPAAFLESLSVEQHMEFWNNELLSGQSTTLVSIRNGAMDGWISGGLTRDKDTEATHEIIALYVTPESWGNGTGARLIERFQHAMDGDTGYSLWVLEENQRAIHFYQKLGFRPDGRSKSLRIGGLELNEIRMARITST